MPVKQKRLRELLNFLPADAIEWRPGSITKDGSKGMALAYLQSRAIMDRLDEVCGPGNWESRLRRIDKGFVCELSVNVDHEDGTSSWVTKTDVSDESDIEALKGSASGALKRAAVLWGIGRYLYSLPSVWHPMKKNKDGKYLRYFDGTPKLPAKFLPTKADKITPAVQAPAPKEEEDKTLRFLEDEVYPIGEAKGYGQGEIRVILKKHFKTTQEFTRDAVLAFLEKLEPKPEVQAQAA